ncbi:hypothetical protein [Streptomyces halobius]|uniref:Uncharacterized protein n=1 Tax=Streptomyces halobius TaxID=2879846 RepID=A0ABY4M972_9ACTN|nr:hypothetical protein [Streptomyces halobius]UQA93688.1 hypothetical protein K9S39_19110 [Streptomyces halobius]
MSTFIHDHSTRLYGIAAAALSLIAYYVEGLPTGLILALAAAILGTGEAVQRVEDRKTSRALLLEPPHTIKD